MICELVLLGAFRLPGDLRSDAWRKIAGHDNEKRSIKRRCVAVQEFDARGINLPLGEHESTREAFKPQW